ncbi:TPA: hypothetical protein DHW62_03900 [candidate division WWE3 bacterium]|uniref:Ferric oxidoreductase domain-containing protein n=1 Tax=candidate division WWE3 bacterium TaxID=2053526 RepID=A0A656PMT1_UNCKA|nr:Sulfoxide reductase heme-binding subunit YedZ [candidate division WWE3 bacterium RAAC2_WWE3_1]KKS29705.1 MAG: Sulfoxide reductase heme-binding subunit YedZ [candidate division WWE3 bacterium GW2011_GWB1_42_117]KKS55515.1 MAG: Sulfoxide reductase heme-binding subunit YedZ [candidate division WWE3 bacterium GW2011_GWD2_42_34]KKT06000.1 MAG: Sulfoxide reductase heme-binding subunit YedZ [candidate division WWE3 bacterium GW2011_GWE2_43_18]KKT06918.1 MAG: Sulfoxide reductase heme-binding subunit
MNKEVRRFVYLEAMLLWAYAYLGLWPFDSLPQPSRYAFLAVIFLYSTLMVSPLTIVFPNIPYKLTFLRARKALGISSFFFALTHALTAFRDSLGGFQGIVLFSLRELLPYIIGASALLILTAMAATSPPSMVNRLGRYWKRLHRFVYLAGVLILVHVAMVPKSIKLPIVLNYLIFAMVGFLIVLELIRFNRFLSIKYKFLENKRFWPLLSFAILYLIYILSY